MIIVFVIDNFERLTNGTTISARRFREELEKRRHTVRVVSDMDEADEQKGLYCLRVRNIPIVSRVASWNNMRFAQFDEATIRRAFTGADVVHLFFPWDLQKRCLAIARDMGIPVTAAFHCQSENVTYNIKLKYFGFLNSVIYWWFYRKLYRDVGHIHCPSAFAAGELKKHHYKAMLHIFSNGVQDHFRLPLEEGADSADPYSQCTPDATIHILMTGRLSAEKRQDVVIKAVNHSRHRARIQLHFAGKGPRERYYRRMSAALPLSPEFRFVSQEELVGLIHRSYIYIHASEVEIEGLGCLEALACGLVPVIANSEKSAAPQFALDERSLFRTGDWRDLRDKIDYWIDNPAERQRMRLEYARLGEKYRVSASARLMEEMFAQAIAENRQGL